MIDINKASIQDLEKHVHRNSPKFPTNKTVKAVVVENTEAMPIPVNIVDGIGGFDQFTFFDDTVLVPANIQTKIVEYLVPVGKVFNMDRITCSGENIAKFTVKINNVINKVKRSHYGDGLNAVFEYSKFDVPAGQKIEVFAEHFNVGNDGDFEATIEGKIK